MDERDYIQKVLQARSLVNHPVNASTASPLAHTDTVLSILQEPYFAPTLEIFWELYSAASDFGCRIYIDGFDGDETVSHGLERFAEMLVNFDWRNLLREAKAFSHRRSSSPSILNVLRRYAFKPMLSHWLIWPPAIFRRHLNYGEEYVGLLREEIKNRYSLNDHENHLTSFKSDIPLAKYFHITKLESGAIPRGLEITNQLAAYHGLEINFPFFDRRLMEYCVGIPPDQKLSDGWTRVVLRRAIKDHIPEDIRLRLTKADFGAYFAYTLDLHERATLDELALDDANPLFNYVDQKKFRSLLSRYYSAPTSMVREAEMLYASLTLSRWISFIMG
jgi:asparagine synthase (glutamine-hydrolysing)